MTGDVARFYDAISDRYHLLHTDWEAWAETTVEALDGVIARLIGPGPHRVLDCSCGIGTQAIGLAARGHDVVGTDLSERALGRAAREARERGVVLRTARADMRRLGSVVAGPFDVVLSCDNSIAHLLPSELSIAFREMAGVLRPGGVVLISVRDYARLAEDRPRFMSPAVAADGRRVAFQLWDWAEDGSTYLLSQFFLEERDGGWEVACERARLYAHTDTTVLGSLREAGLADVRWHDPGQSGYYQPIATGRRP